MAYTICNEHKMLISNVNSMAGKAEIIFSKIDGMKEDISEINVKLAVIKTKIENGDISSKISVKQLGTIIGSSLGVAILTVIAGLKAYGVV